MNRRDWGANSRLEVQKESTFHDRTSRICRCFPVEFRLQSLDSDYTIDHWVVQIQNYDCHPNNLAATGQKEVLPRVQASPCSSSGVASFWQAYMGGPERVCDDHTSMNDLLSNPQILKYPKYDLVTRLHQITISSLSKYLIKLFWLWLTYMFWMLSSWNIADSYVKKPLPWPATVPEMPGCSSLTLRRSATAFFLGGLLVGGNNGKPISKWWVSVQIFTAAPHWFEDFF